MKKNTNMNITKIIIGYINNLRKYFRISLL